MHPRSLSSRYMVIATLALAASLPAPPLPVPELPRGSLIEHVSCTAMPGESYTLYLPSFYQPARQWPILYVLDARGRGRLAAERFRAAAERYGWVVAASEQSASDGPLEPNVAAMRALWVDTHSRFSIDDRRVYAAGYSGTVRAACTLADLAPGSIAGVIGASGGFAPERPPRKDTSFAFFGTTGTRDFNYYELGDLDVRLTELGLRHRIEVFAGGHEWMPEELAGRAVGWMELQAIKHGSRAMDLQLLDALWQRDLGDARRLEAAGELYEAQRAYAALAADFDGLGAWRSGEVAELKREAAALGDSPVVRAESSRREKRNKRDHDYLERARTVLARDRGPGSDPGDEEGGSARAIRELSIADLKHRAASDPDPEERLSASRLLNTVSVQTGFYLPRLFIERNELDRALVSLEIAAKIDSGDPDVWYQLAAAYAAKDNGKRAFELLERAMAAGWSDRTRLQADPAFKSIREQPEYRRLLAALTAGAAKAR